MLVLPHDLTAAAPGESDDWNWGIPVLPTGRLDLAHPWLGFTLYEADRPPAETHTV
ncbi:hypothetical protein [Streptomyces sp. NPDC088254]|uniref:hypothetical protein n=1 Tax=Streptomyces sp. NPDC088254 TaxID=3365847 RepID=UPI0037F49266